MSTRNDVADTVRRHWAARAATFDDSPGHGLHSVAQHEVWAARVRAWSGDRPIDALDIGCGTGFLALLLAEQGHRVTGVDVAWQMLEVARRKAAERGLPVTFRHGDATALPVPDRSFDLAVERHVIWTLTDPPVALLEWRRALRRGGRLVLVEGDWREPAPDSPSYADYAPIKDALPLYGGRPAPTLAAIASGAGFTVEDVEPLMNPVLWGEAPQRERYALIAQTSGA